MYVGGKQSLSDSDGRFIYVDICDIQMKCLLMYCMRWIPDSGQVGVVGGRITAQREIGGPVESM